MKLRNWLWATRFAMVVVMVGCTPPKTEPQGDVDADSLRVVALTMRLDSMQAALEKENLEQAELNKALGLIRDSVAMVDAENHPNNKPDVGGEARGAPIWRDPKGKEVGK